MDNTRIKPIAEFSTILYLVNKAVEQVNLRSDIADNANKRETVCFNAVIETFGGK